MQSNADIGFGHSHTPGDLLHAAGIKVAAHKDRAGTTIQASQKSVDKLFEDTFILDRRFTAWHTAIVFVDGRFKVCVAFLRFGVAVAVKGKISCDTPEKSLQIVRFFRRYGTPGVIPGIVDTFLAVSL